jgi:hypothetical protein
MNRSSSDFCRTLRLYGTVGLLAVSGCAWWPSTQLNQCKEESNQLLSHYQLESQRAKRLESQNRDLQTKIAGLEKQLAVVHETGSPPNLGVENPDFPQKTEAIPASTGSTSSPTVPSTKPLPDAEPPQSAWRPAPKRKF